MAVILCEINKKGVCLTYLGVPSGVNKF